MAHLPLVVLAFLPGVGLAIATLWLRGPGHWTSSATADEYLDHSMMGGRCFCVILRIVWLRRSRLWEAGVRSGLEGPSIYIGSVMGSSSQRRFRALLRDADRNLFVGRWSGCGNRGNL